MKLGIVTYNIAAQWDVHTIISVCSEIGLEGAELRTTHAHGVEVDLSPSERAEIRAKFADSSVQLAGLGSAFEYHATCPDEVRLNIEMTKDYIRLAADVDAAGVKVRPNGLPEGVPVEKTIAQIGGALHEVGVYGAEFGVEIRLEVHGAGSCHPPYIADMLAAADHANVKACWNSNETDRDSNGNIDANFALLHDKIGLVHINRLHSGYPYRDLFGLLQKIGYDGFTLAEIPACADLESSKELLRYYKALWSELQP